MGEPAATRALVAGLHEQAHAGGQGRSGSGAMRTRAVLLAAALMLVPLGARAADLVVWWEEGFYPEEDRAVQELVAAFEAKTGKDVELVRQPHAAQAEVAAAIKAGRPPDFLWGLGGTTDPSDQWAYEDRLVELDEALGPLK